jgi:ribosome biogenesis protein NSA1
LTANNVQALCEETGQLAVGGKGSEVSVWSIEKQERTYQAKGAKPNRIGLMDKPWNTAVAFLPGSQGSQVVVGTGQHKVRVYHVSQKRPKLSVEFGEARITALAPTADGEIPTIGLDCQNAQNMQVTSDTFT